MNKEDFFISHFSSSSRKIGDDGAIIGSYVYSKDAFFENIHFKRSWLSLYDIAKKAMLVNLSDAVAMNAKPEYVLLSVAIPSSLSRSEISELARGFSETASTYGVEIIGGDTISNTKIDITITVMSKLYAKPLQRRGLKAGDLLAYTGSLGSSKKALRYLLSGGQAHTKSKFRDIQLRSEFIQNSARYLSAGMDISDGLMSDLDKLSKINHLGFHFIKNIEKNVVCSGEEYEMLISFSPRERKTLIRLAEKARVKLNIFAKARRTRFKNSCKSNHF